MIKPFLFFALKCTVIIYFTICSGFNHFSTEKSATSLLTRGTWKVKFICGKNNEQITELEDYTFVFNNTGDLNVYKNGIIINGNWAEDNISKRISLNFGTTNKLLKKLNKHWEINNISKSQIILRSNDSKDNGSLNIASL